MMGMLRESFLRRLGDEDLVMERGGGEENLRLALGDLGGSPYSSLLFWLFANRSSRDLGGETGKGQTHTSSAREVMEIPHWQLQQRWVSRASHWAQHSRHEPLLPCSHRLGHPQSSGLSASPICRYRNSWGPGETALGWHQDQAGLGSRGLTWDRGVMLQPLHKLCRSFRGRTGHWHGPLQRCHAQPHRAGMALIGFL